MSIPIDRLMFHNERTVRQIALGGVGPAFNESSVINVNMVNLWTPNTSVENYASATLSASTLQFTAGRKRISAGVAVNGNMSEVGVKGFAYQYEIVYKVQSNNSGGERLSAMPVVCRGPDMTGVESGETPFYKVLPPNGAGSATQGSNYGEFASSCGWVGIGNYGQYDDAPVFFGVAITGVENGVAINVNVSLAVTARLYADEVRLWEPR